MASYHCHVEVVYLWKETLTIKFIIDARVSSEIGIEDKNLTALVSENIEKIGRRNSIPCV